MTEVQDIDRKPNRTKYREYSTKIEAALPKKYEN